MSPIVRRPAPVGEPAPPRSVAAAVVGRPAAGAGEVLARAVNGQNLWVACGLRRHAEAGRKCGDRCRQRYAGPKSKLVGHGASSCRSGLVPELETTLWPIVDRPIRTRYGDLILFGHAESEMPQTTVYFCMRATWKSCYGD
jgi:hypothetical protein